MQILFRDTTPYLGSCVAQRYTECKCEFPNPAAQFPNPCLTVPRPGPQRSSQIQASNQSSQIQVPIVVPKSRPRPHPAWFPKPVLFVISEPRSRFGVFRSRSPRIPNSSSISASSFFGVPKSGFPNPGRVPESRSEFLNLGSRNHPSPFLVCWLEVGANVGPDRV